MAKQSPATLQQQFKTVNFIGLAMIASVFLYAAIVLGIDKGYIPFKIKQSLDSGLVTRLKYILLFLSFFNYVIIRFFNRFSFKSANYLPAGSIITFALCEAVGIYGLVLFFLSGNPNDFFIFMFISLLYFFLFYPKYAEWEKLSNQGSETDTPG